MRYAIAVQRLRVLAARCQQAAGLWDDEPFITAVYAFGEVLDGRDGLDCVEIVLVINQPPAEVPLGARPESYFGLAQLLEVAKPWVMWYLRPSVWPVSDHRIRRPLRIWSVGGGPDIDALEALARGDAEPLRLPAQDASDARVQVADELVCRLAQLRTVIERYWDREWRSEHAATASTRNTTSGKRSAPT